MFKLIVEGQTFGCAHDDKLNIVYQGLQGAISVNLEVHVGGFDVVASSSQNTHSHYPSGENSL